MGVLPSPSSCAFREQEDDQAILSCSLQARSFLFARGGPIGLPLRASNEGLRRPRVARAKETNGLPLLPAFAPRPPAESSEVPAEAPLPCSPILAFLNPFEGMPKVGTADPPEIRERPNAGENGEPES